MRARQTQKASLQQTLRHCTLTSSELSSTCIFSPALDKDALVSKQREEEKTLDRARAVATYNYIIYFLLILFSIIMMQRIVYYWCKFTWKQDYACSRFSPNIWLVNSAYAGREHRRHACIYRSLSQMHVRT